MRKIILTIIAFLIIAVASFYIFKASPKITNYPPSGRTIVAFGDSLVEGMEATAGNDFVSLLAQKIGEPIVNMGAAGDNTRQGLERIKEVNLQDPKLVLVLFGGNDFLQKVPIKETFENMDKILEELQKEGAIVILLGVQGGLLSDPYEEYFEDLAKNRGTLYVSNVLDGLIGHREYMSDAIHPNDAGYEKIAEKIYPILVKALK